MRPGIKVKLVCTGERIPVEGDDGREYACGKVIPANRTAFAKALMIHRAVLPEVIGSWWYNKEEFLYEIRGLYPRKEGRTSYVSSCKRSEAVSRFCDIITPEMLFGELAVKSMPKKFFVPLAW